jgi:hypothetical protein
LPCNGRDGVGKMRAPPDLSTGEAAVTRTTVDSNLAPGVAHVARVAPGVLGVLGVLGAPVVTVSGRAA